MIAAMRIRPSWTRERVKRYLVQRFYTRFHMSLILASSTLAAMLASAGLLWLGVTAMLVRYPLAVAVAYLTFLAGVGLWIRYLGLGRESAAGRGIVDSADLPDVSVGGGSSSPGSAGGLGRGGGSFDGGGASASWAEGPRPPAMPAGMQTQNLAAAASPDTAADVPSIKVGKSGGGGGSFSLGDFGDLDGEAIVLLALALAAIAAIFVASGYLVWFAPDILTEAAFGALLAGGLARRSGREDAGGWVAGVVRKTWWPFAIVTVVVMAFAGYAQKHYPAAHTFRQAIEHALAPVEPAS
jgi:hypothetical protein